MSEEKAKRKARRVAKEAEKVVKGLMGKLEGGGYDKELDALLCAILLLAQLAIAEAELVEAYEGEYL